MTTALDYKDVLIVPKASSLSSRKEADLNREIVFKNGTVYNGIPIISANMSSVSTFQMAEALGKLGLSSAIHKHYNEEQLIQFFNVKDHSDQHWYTLGMSNSDYEKFLTVNSNSNIKFVCIDVANGYQDSFVNFIKMFKQKHEDKVIMAGNIVTPEGVERLAKAGADVVKCGIGQGSFCLTRIKTGVGYPQLSATMNCARAADDVGVHLCSDGGLTCPGDFAKSFGAGADFTMAGGIFAGHSECGGEIIARQYLTNELDGNGKQIIKTKMFSTGYGMSSEVAMKKHNGGMAEYRSSEGKCVEIPFKGSVHGTVGDILGGIRSAMTYIGAKSIEEISQNCNFIKVNSQSNEIFGKNS